MSRTAQLDPIDGVLLSRDRTTLVEDWLQHPLLNLSIAAANANRNFEILGTNAIDGSAAFDAAGGITLTTAGADADQVILTPHLDTTQTAWAATTWNTSQQPIFSARIKTGASIANAILWAGLKLTNTPVVATDNDQVFLRYEDDVNDGKLQLVSSNNGTDTTKDTGVTLAASTEYLVQILVDGDRVPHLYIDGAHVIAGAALKANVSLIPYIGVEADGAAAAKALTVRPRFVCSRLIA